MPSNQKSKKHKARKLIIAAILTLIITLGLLLIGSALGYVLILTHPGCKDDVQPLPELPTPNEVWLRNTQDQVLRAWYYPPQNGAVVLAAGAREGSLGQNLPPAAFLIQEGYGVLQIDQRNCAQPASAVTMGMKEIEDIEAGLAYLKTRSEVKRIGIFGFSMGGVTAIRAAARNPEIASVVAEGGYHNMGENITKPLKHKSMLETLYLYSVAGLFWVFNGVNPWQVSPIDDLPAISPRADFLIYGEHEADSGFARMQYEAAREPKQLWIVPGGDHGVNHSLDAGKYEARILEFFNGTLLP